MQGGFWRGAQQSRTQQIQLLLLEVLLFRFACRRLSSERPSLGRFSSRWHLPRGSNYRGGGIWVAGEGGAVARTVAGQPLEGHVFSTVEGPVLFNPHLPHSTEAWRGSRYVIVAYCVRGLEKLQPCQVAAATELGFVLPRFVSDTGAETAELGVAVQAPGGAPSSPSFGQSPAGQVEGQAKAFSGGAGQVSPACSSAVLDFPHQVPRPSGQAALSSDSLPEVRALPDHPPSAVLDLGLDAKLPAGLVNNLTGLRSTPSCGEPPEPESTHSPAGQVAGQAQAFSGGAGLNCAESPLPCSTSRIGRSGPQDRLEVKPKRSQEVQVPNAQGFRPLCSTSQA